MSLGPELVCVWTPKTVVDAPVSWLSDLQAGGNLNDVTMRMLWTKDIKVGMVDQVRERMEGEGVA